METDVQPSNDPANTQQQSPVPVPTLESIYHALFNYPFDSDPEFQLGLESILAGQAQPTGDEEKKKQEETVLQAQCFYFARKYNLPFIDPTSYVSWLQSHNQIRSHVSRVADTVNLPPPPLPTDPLDSFPHQPISPPTSFQTGLSPHHVTATTTNSTTVPPGQASSPNVSATSTSTTEPQSNTQGQQHEQPEPPYPSSFAALVELITNNKPIPGIEQIPDTVLDPGSSLPNKTPQRRKPWEKDRDDDDNNNNGPDRPSEQNETEVGLRTGEAANPWNEASDLAPTGSAAAEEDEVMVARWNENPDPNFQIPLLQPLPSVLTARSGLDKSSRPHDQESQ